MHLEYRICSRPNAGRCILYTCTLYTVRDEIDLCTLSISEWYICWLLTRINLHSINLIWGLMGLRHSLASFEHFATAKRLIESMSKVIFIFFEVYLVYNGFIFDCCLFSTKGMKKKKKIVANAQVHEYWAKNVQIM